LRREHPERKILLTFFSPSGYEMRKEYDQVDKVSYLPFATRLNAKRFVQAYEPSMAIFVKYEFWPAYLKQLRKRGIPTYNIATIFRKSQAFFRPWGMPYRRLLRCFTTLFVQDERSLELLERYGYQNAVVAGDTRFDRVVEVLRDKREISQLMRFTEPEVNALHFDSAPPKVIVAGSTWPKDEELLARYLSEHPDIKLVLTPHEIGAGHLHQIFNLFQGQLVRFSEATLMNVNTNRVLLIDRMGMLSRLYRFATVAYVGGGFGAGIHNTLEAAVYGVPVVFGPRYHKFREAEDLIEHGAAFSVNDYRSFAAAMDETLAHPEEYGRKAGEYVRSEVGATDKIYNALFNN
jgi:3-deoxy-D-manno-octulosonic-acid transferase